MVEQLQSHIVQIIHERCGSCSGFTQHFLRQGVFLCHDHPTTATYRSTLVSPFSTEDRNSSYLLGILQDWISTAPSLTLDYLLVRINPNCSTAVPRLDSAECASGRSFPANSTITERIQASLNQCVIEELAAKICNVL